jgi:hypothetical protein
MYYLHEIVCVYFILKADFVVTVSTFIFTRMMIMIDESGVQDNFHYALLQLVCVIQRGPKVTSLAQHLRRIRGCDAHPA